MSGTDNDDATRWEVRREGTYVEVLKDGESMGDIDYHPDHGWFYGHPEGEQPRPFKDGEDAEAWLMEETGHPGTTTPGDAPGDCEGEGESEFPAWVMLWRDHGGCGVSSETLVSAMLGMPPGLIAGYDSPPSDLGDFERCVEVLDYAASAGDDWRTRLAPVMSEVDGWEGLVEVWAEVEKALGEGCRSKARRIFEKATR